MNIAKAKHHRTNEQKKKEVKLSKFFFPCELSNKNNNNKKEIKTKPTAKSASHTQKRGERKEKKTEKNMSRSLILHRVSTVLRRSFVAKQDPFFFLPERCVAELTQ